MRRIFFFILLTLLLGCNTSKRRNANPESISLDTVTQWSSDLQGYTAEDYEPPPSKTKSKPVLRSVPLPAPMSRDNTPAMKDGITVPTASLTAPKPQSISTLIDREIGRLVYDIPDTMKMGEMVIVRIRINRDTSDKTIRVGINGVDTIIRVTQTMNVSIIDPTTNSFLILKNNGDEQLIEDHEYSEWVFNITPLKSGTNKLNLVVSIIINGKVKEQVYTDVVYVKISARIVVKTWWEKYWEWIFSTLLIPFSIWLYSRRKKRKNKNHLI